MSTGARAVPSYHVQGRGKALVLIMGLGGSKDAWYFQLRAFKKLYQVITFDNRGVGHRKGGGLPSAPCGVPCACALGRPLPLRWPTRQGRQAQGTPQKEPEGQPYTIRTMADDTISLLDHLGIDRAHVLGYSLGGIVAQEIAISFPKRVRKLILASTTAMGTGLDETTGMQHALDLGPISGGQDVEDLKLRNLMPTLVELAFNKQRYRAILKLLVRPYARQIGLDGLAGQLKALANLNTLDRLPKIQALTLVMTGTQDRVVPPSASKVLVDRVPNSRLILIEGGSHALSIEMRGRFNHKVLHFLSGP